MLHLPYISFIFFAECCFKEEEMWSIDSQRNLSQL